jgi:signal transduction histidine kinase
MKIFSRGGTFGLIFIILGFLIFVLAGTILIYAPYMFIGILGIILGYALASFPRKKCGHLELLETLSIPILSIDAYSRIRYANQAAHRLLGYESASLGSLYLEALMPGHKYFWKRIRQRKNRADAWKLSLLLRHKREHLIPTEVIIAGDIQAPDQGLWLYLWDGRWARGKERNLEIKWQRVEKISQAKSVFVSLVSHEFRTPMAAIQAASDLLAGYWEHLPPEERKEYLGQISANILRMSRMMDDILLLGKIQNGQLCFKTSLVDPLTLCQEAIQFVQVYGKKSRVTVMVSEDFPPMCSIDPSLFSYILVNLLSNALKYSPPDAKVALILRWEPKNLILEIADKGIGIPKKDQGKIFHLFHRGDNVGSAKGMGVGMFMVKYCVDLHHGSIAFRSTLGRGTTFQVKLPADL